MFRIDPVFFHPLIPYLPAGHALALIPIIPGREESDEFRMYEFKVRMCPVSRPHDWTACPWAHPGERARRRDPRCVGYKAVPCEEYRVSQSCRRGNGCEFAHGVFEYWLHPARYRTRACTAGVGCTRKVCFFAHAPQELRAETRCPLTPVEESMTTAVAREGEVLESIRRLTTRSSEGSNSVECEDDECEMPDVEWIRDLIG